MKKLLVLIALCLTSSIQAQDNPDFKKDAIEFIKLTGSGTVFENVISQLGGMVSEANKANYTKEAKASLEGVYDKIAEVYMEEFTHEEVKALIKFYNTDLGKKLAEKQLTLTQKGMMIGQSWGMEVQAIAQKYN